MVQHSKWYTFVLYSRKTLPRAHTQTYILQTHTNTLHTHTHTHYIFICNVRLGSYFGNYLKRFFKGATPLLVTSDLGKPMLTPIHTHTHWSQSLYYLKSLSKWATPVLVTFNLLNLRSHQYKRIHDSCPWGHLGMDGGGGLTHHLLPSAGDQKGMLMD